jgi:hypothetical protein
LLDSHLNLFPSDFGAIIDEQGERFHQETSIMEKRFLGKWSSSLLADYCYTLAEAETKY